MMCQNLRFTGLIPDLVLQHWVTRMCFVKMVKLHQFVKHNRAEASSLPWRGSEGSCLLFPPPGEEFKEKGQKA